MAAVTSYDRCHDEGHLDPDRPAFPIADLKLLHLPDVISRAFRCAATGQHHITVQRRIHPSYPLLIHDERWQLLHQLRAPRRHDDADWPHASLDQHIAPEGIEFPFTRHDLKGLSITAL